MYLNEHDPFAAAWLRQLMADGHLAPGTVDERSITDVAATDVRGHRRAHWFAGIAGWELALDLAGWPRERSVWTASCPCQPYSSAGKRKGNADERDLWPTFARLIRECRPPTVFGEQVASAIRFGWIDRVRRDLEAEGYAVGFAVLGAHSTGTQEERWVAYDDGSGHVAYTRERVRNGAPHQRQRLYWVAHTQQHGRGAGHASGRYAGRNAPGWDVANGDAEQRGGAVGSVADADGGFAGHGRVQPGGQHGQQPEDGGVARGLADANEGRREDGRREGAAALRVAHCDGSTDTDLGATIAQPSATPVWDHWRDSITIECRDGNRRRVPAAQSGVLGVVDGLSDGLGLERVPCPHRFPLAGKTPNRVGRLRGYGNAICVQTAALFVRAFLDTEGTA